MKIIKNRLLPFPGFTALNLFGAVFMRKDYLESNPEDLDVTMNHEAIHLAQMKELWFVGFYPAYFFEWLYRLVTTKFPYRKISFEREAYRHQSDPDYLKTRPRFAQWKKRKS